MIPRLPFRFPVGRCLLVLTVLALGCSRGPRAKDLFDEGADRFEAKDYDRAIDSFRRGLELEPRSAIGRNLLGMAYREKYNLLGETTWKDQEIEAFRTAVASDSTYWPAYVNLGASLYYLGKVHEAAAYFRRALVLDPENPQREELEDLIREAGEAVPEVTTG